MTQEAIEHWKEGMETARAQHRFQLERMAESEKHAVSFSHAALRAPILINSGALVSLLAFTSANAPAFAAQQSELREVFSTFLLGVVCAAVAPVGAYFAESARAEIEARVELIYESPYLVQHRGVLDNVWAVLMGATFALVGGGYVLFVIGCNSAFRLIDFLS
jgi:hypothetical protein